MEYEPELIPDLPADVALQCLARVSRSFYPILSLVSKSWHSAIRSPSLFTTRSLLQTTETSLLLNIRIGGSPRLYTLLPNFSKSPQKYLSPLPPLSCQPVGASVAVLGPKIYVIGGSVNRVPLKNMWVFDCRFNKWEAGPRMRFEKEFAATELMGGKIYVIGGSMNRAEVYDPEIGVWSPIPSRTDVRKKMDRGWLVYDEDVGELGNAPKRVDLGWPRRNAVVGEVLYSIDYFRGNIKGYDVEVDEWKELRGLEKGLPKFLSGATMVNYDGRLCIFWESKECGKEEVEIMAAVIEVWKDKDGYFNGKILWSDVILVVPKRSVIGHCMAVQF